MTAAVRPETPNGSTKTRRRGVDGSCLTGSFEQLSFDAVAASLFSNPPIATATDKKQHTWSSLLVDWANCRLATLSSAQV
jgi:hypothetical protein